jgi:hypothetical protein
MLAGSFSFFLMCPIVPIVVQNIRLVYFRKVKLINTALFVTEMRAWFL